MNFPRDVAHALRLLIKHRGFTAVVLVTLALGIGATTAVFSVIDAVLLRPLPYADAGRLVGVAEQLRAFGPGGPTAARSSPAVITSDTFTAWRDSARTLDGLAAYQQRAYTLTGSGEAVRLNGAAVSASLFGMLGATAERGRLFQPGEDRAGANQVAILSDGLWTRRFRRDPSLVGRAITLDDTDVTIVGILPATFYFPDRQAEIWTPMTLDLTPPEPGQRFVLAFAAIGRLKPGVSIAQGEAEGTAIARHAEPPPPPGMHAGGLPPVNVRLIPLQDEIVAGVRPALLVLFAAVGCVLLIGTANVANLLLARGAARRRELAIRAALGAGRGRLLQQLLTESLVLGAAGGALGIALAAAIDRVLPAVMPGNIPRISEATLDLPVLAFACVVSIAVGLVFGMTPAFQAFRLDVVAALGEADVQRTGGFRFLRGNRLRSALVVAEVSLSIVLLAGAGLLVHSFVRLVSVSPGYDPANVVTAQVSPSAVRYATPALQRAYFDRLLARVAAIPGVKAAGTTNLLPLLPGNQFATFAIQGEPRPATPAAMPRASLQIVSAGYAEAIGLRLVAGRFLTAEDRETAPTVAVINEALARQYFRGDALGRRIRLFGPDPIEIVGLVGDVHHAGLDTAPGPELYLAFDQVANALRLRAPATSLVVRTAADPLVTVPFIRQAALDADPGTPLDNVMTMDARLSASVAAPRFYALLLGAFALTALILAAVGIYGVLSYSVSQRSREIGVRMALGAEATGILTLVLWQGFSLVFVGVGIGLAGALGVTRFLKGLLFGVTTTDPAAYVAATAVLMTVALAACWIPARRATRLDPIRALRYE